MPSMRFTLRSLMIAVAVAALATWGFESARRHFRKNAIEGTGWDMPHRFKYYAEEAGSCSMVGDLCVNINDVKKGINPPRMVWTTVSIKPFKPRPKPVRPYRPLSIYMKQGKRVPKRKVQTIGRGPGAP